MVITKNNSGLGQKEVSKTALLWVSIKSASSATSLPERLRTNMHSQSPTSSPNATVYDSINSHSSYFWTQAAQRA